MSSYATIANLIASKIGSDDQITAPDDDTHIARSIKAVWDTERRAAIRDHSWNMAAQRAELPAIADPGTIYPWGYAFEMPADSLRLIEVLNDIHRSEYALEGRQILANTLGPLYIRYLIDVPETGLWDALFVEAFACRMAIQVGPRIAGSNFNLGAAQASYANALSAAKRTDARENPPIPQEIGSWEEARLSSGGGDWGYR